jgi:hypothetical protein
VLILHEYRNYSAGEYNPGYSEHKTTRFQTEEGIRVYLREKMQYRKDGHFRYRLEVERDGQWQEIPFRRRDFGICEQVAYDDKGYGEGDTGV